MDIRSATEADQRAIRRWVWRARVNPCSLHWRCFVVAQEGAHIVGIGQIKQHPDGVRELASMVVDPKWRGRGIATDLGHALLARQSGPVYLTCRQPLAAFYKRLGFCQARRDEVPPNFWRVYRVSCFFARWLGIELRVMKHHGA